MSWLLVLFFLAPAVYVVFVVVVAAVVVVAVVVVSWLFWLLRLLLLGLYNGLWFVFVVRGMISISVKQPTHGMQS